jgi:hypothetical protein
MTKLHASAISFTDDGYSTLLGFADDANMPVAYVMLNMTNAPDEQDLNLNQGGVHIDAGILQIDGYDLIQDICETGTGIILTLTEKAAKDAGVGKSIEIDIDTKIVGEVPVSQVVRKFKDRLSSWEKSKVRLSII